MSQRTETERKANSIDCDLYRIICQVETLYDTAKRRRFHQMSADLHRSLQGLRGARIGIRMLMHEDDRDHTS